jgi:hypothetical protein
MKTTIKAIKRGVKAALAGPKPHGFVAGGKTVACSHCGRKDFVPYDMENFPWEGLLKQNYGLECSACSHLEFFSKKPVCSIPANQ